MRHLPRKKKKKSPNKGSFLFLLKSERGFDMGLKLKLFFTRAIVTGKLFASDNKEAMVVISAVYIGYRIGKAIERQKVKRFYGDFSNRRINLHNWDEYDF
jgi:hypothetical protein